MNRRNRQPFPRQARVAGLASVLLLGAADAAAAGPARLALTIGNQAYEDLPQLPACPSSAGEVARALKALEYEVLERQDLTSGGLGAALAELARRMQAEPGASVVLYFCGYTAGLNDRPFILPVSANLRRATDVMTQGLLIKALLDLLERGAPSRAVVALDLAPLPDSAPPPMAVLDALPTPAGAGLIAAVGPPPESGPTPLAAALAQGLAAPDVESEALLAQAKAALEGAPGMTVGSLRMPQVSRSLAADETPQPPAAPSVADLPPPAAPPPDTPAPAAPAAADLPDFPDEAQMTDSERRWVQEALKRLGYYAGPVDGIFGPETRAGIRRLQYEQGEAMTGVITGRQAARLIATAR